MTRVGPVLGELAVADHGGDEEDDEVRRDHQRQGLVRAGDQHQHQREQRDGQELDPQPVRDEPAPAEHERERQEIDRQRPDPEQRDRRDVGGQVRRHAQHQARRHGGEGDPARAPRERDGPVCPAPVPRPPAGASGRRPRLLRTAGPRPPEADGAGGGEQDEAAVPPGPEAALRLQVEEPLDDQRVREEREQAPDVAGRVEDVGIAGGPVLGGGEPGLENGAGGGDREEGEPDGDGEKREEPRHGARVAGRDPARRQRDRQGRERQEQDRDVEPRLAPEPEPARGDVRVRVTDEQDRLIEHHRRVPHRRRAPQERQRHPREHGLDQEQEARADEDRRPEEDQHARPDARRARGAPGGPAANGCILGTHRAPRATFGRESTRWAS